MTSTDSKLILYRFHIFPYVLQNFKRNWNRVKCMNVNKEMRGKKTTLTASYIYIKNIK